MFEIGKVNSLTVSRETKSGFYLKDDDSIDEIFMPPSMAPINLQVGQTIEAFIYIDTKGGLIATDQRPYAQVGEYALMRVVDNQEFGAFFDWGIEKDLLVPGNEQKVKVRNFEDHIVRVCLEEGTDRVYGTTKLGKFIENSVFDFAPGDSIEIVPVQKTDLGFRAIINKKFIGMIYDNEIFSKVVLKKTYQGYAKKLREDGLVDASLQVQGIKNVVDAKETILEMLRNSGGHSPLYDKSSPADIKMALSMSKQTFKNAIGMLYKERKITISAEGIKLTN
ncbi:S1 RNA-binding domain-containing protein [Halobacteriovorax sp. HLS]|uniref:CvfB family protein n=1 Tax=Halobacteriovorax sp. HLS TaxID=2234000 RepID=UPI000FDAF4B6|nr:S1-like domain-containing RNA-binding protein [Halobacteriovorax sp. HLS]